MNDKSISSVFSTSYTNDIYVLILDAS